MADLLAHLREIFAGRYDIERPLGRGGMATVYLARDVTRDRQVALKVLHPELAATLSAERFAREIEIISQLDHPGIVPLYDSGEVDDVLFYAMPVIDGETLRARLDRERRLPLEDALAIVGEVGEALNYAHGLGVIHRDIKPENIMLAGGRAVVGDFGIARALDGAGGARLTQTGLALGTPWYMSPEQALGRMDIDARSDIYSLALVFFEMVTGTKAHGGSTPVAVVSSTVRGPVPQIRAILPELPEHIASTIEQALAKAPDDRFDTAEHFVAALTDSHRVVRLEDAAPDAEGTRGPGGWLRRWWRRRGGDR